MQHLQWDRNNPRRDVVEAWWSKFVDVYGRHLSPPQTLEEELVIGRASSDGGVIFYGVGKAIPDAMRTDIIVEVLPLIPRGTSSVSLEVLPADQVATEVAEFAFYCATVDSPLERHPPNRRV